MWNSKSEVQNPNPDVRSLAEVQQSEVGVWRLKSVRSLSEVCHRSKSENCPKSVWNGLHDSDHHWSAVLLILITYIIHVMYFVSLFGYICRPMFVFVVWQINLPSLWVWSLTSDVWSTGMSEVHKPKSENWCLKSTICSLMYEVWRNLKFEVRKLSELCPKSEVQSMSKIQVWNQSLKSVSCMLSKSETEVQIEANAQNLKLKVWSRKSIWSPFKIVCNYYNFVIQYQYYILCVCRLIITIAGQLYR